MHMYKNIEKKNPISFKIVLLAFWVKRYETPVNYNWSLLCQPNSINSQSWPTE